MADTLRTRQHGIEELLGLERVGVAAPDHLEPFHRVARGVLDPRYVDAPQDLIGGKRIANARCVVADYIELPREFAHYVASKGSIAINGISLTVSEVLPKSFDVWIIPYTKRHTNLDRARAGDLVNLEFDIIAKYVERMVSPLIVRK